MKAQRVEIDLAVRIRCRQLRGRKLRDEFTDQPEQARCRACADVAVQARFRCLAAQVQKRRDADAQPGDEPAADRQRAVRTDAAAQEFQKFRSKVAAKEEHHEQDGGSRQPGHHQVTGSQRRHSTTEKPRESGHTGDENAQPRGLGEDEVTGGGHHQGDKQTSQQGRHGPGEGFKETQVTTTGGNHRHTCDAAGVQDADDEAGQAENEIHHLGRIYQDRAGDQRAHGHYLECQPDGGHREEDDRDRRVDGGDGLGLRGSHARQGTGPRTSGSWGMRMVGP